jgi:hypothetical protein
VAGWATLGFLFGTSFLVCATFPIDTYFAHICAVMFTVVALHEAFGRQSGLLIGFALGFAFLSRQLTVLTIPFVWAVLFLVRPKEQQPYMAVRSVLTTCIGLACCAVLYGYFNWARFGDPLETGYDILSLSEPGWYGYRAQNWGNFHWVYIPSNLIRMFLSGFSMDFEGPGLMIPHMGSFGSSLTFASPVVFYAMYARNTRARGLTIAAWFSIGLTALAVLAHKSALGGYQVNGIRYALDFMPVLFILIALGIERTRGTGLERLAQGLIVYTFVLNILAVDGITVIREVLLQLPH